MPGQVKFVLQAEQAQAVGSFLKLVDAQKKSEDGFERNKRSATGFDKALGRITASLAGPLSMAAALAVVNRHWETFLTQTREIAGETRKASQEMIAFAALQAGGTRAERVGRAAELGARFGVQDRGEAFNTVQALQSAISAARPQLTEAQAFEQGLSASQTVFRASQLGVPVAAGTEAEILGAAQGLRPGQNLRNLYTAGQASARDPALLAGAAPGLQFFQDKQFGAAAAGVLAGTFGAETPTYLRQAGVGLSRVGGLQKYLEGEGLGDLSQRERVQFLGARGLTRPEQLKGVGVTELRQQSALGVLAGQAAGVEYVLGEVRRKAVPGVLGAQRAGVETEQPIFTATRQIERVQAEMLRERALGERAMPRTELELEQRIRGLALQRMGGPERGFFGGRIADEEGRVTRLGAIRAEYAPWGRDLHSRISQEEHDGTSRFHRVLQETMKRIADALEKGQALQLTNQNQHTEQ